MNKKVTALAAVFSLLGGVFLGLPLRAEEGAVPSPAVAVENPLLVSVGDQALYLEDLREHVRRNPLFSGHMGTPAGIRRVLNDLVNQRLLEMEGTRRNIAREEGVTAGEYVLQVRKDLMESCLLPGEEEVKRFYDEHPEVFSTPRLLRIARVYVPVETEVEGKGAEAWLRAAADAVRAGQRPFDGVIAQVPAAVSEKIRQGDMGFLAMAEEDPLIELLKAAKVGDVIGPHVREGHVGLFAILDERAPTVVDWETVKPKAAQVAYSQCMQTNFAKLRKTMEEHFPVVFNEETVAQLKP